MLDVFQTVKQQSLLIKDIKGENPLFAAVRTGVPLIFNWFYITATPTPADGIIQTTPNGQMVSGDFFKARGEQNYKGQTVEHILCITRETMEIVDTVKPRPDIKDYYGCLPLFYSLEKNDVEMVTRLFKKGRDYYNLRNYKLESIFHMAAKNGSLDSLKILVDGVTFTEELLKKDYTGNTPLHYAAKKGNVAMLEYFITEGGTSVRMMLDIMNDFGYTVRESVVEKIRYLDEAV